MRCFHPLPAWQKEDGRVVFAERGKIARPLTLRCGQCIGCRLDRSRSWAIRCVHEASLHERNCFVTLTFSDEFLPADSGLDYRQFQRFMKRLRKAHGSVRFFMCGEYGERYARPHFHACLFGFDFLDKRLFKSLSSGSALYTSEALAKLWPFGFSSVGDVTFESAAYVARYIMKKVTGPGAVKKYQRVDGDTGEIFSVCPEFTHMSLKPGIGKGWISKYLGDVYEHDYVVVDGQKLRPPRYYDKYLESVDPYGAEAVSLQRYLSSEQYLDDSTEARLKVLQTVAEARLQFKKRTLE